MTAPQQAGPSKAGGHPGPIPRPQTPEWAAFELAVHDLAQDGLRVPCAGDERHTSDDDRERAQAVTVCQGCPLTVECAAAADSTGERFGVWAGVDLKAKANRAARESAQRARRTGPRQRTDAA